jgi:hypothetical protein
MVGSPTVTVARTELNYPDDVDQQLLTGAAMRRNGISRLPELTGDSSDKTRSRPTCSTTLKLELAREIWTAG